jgi:hypothetical protein
LLQPPNFESKASEPSLAIPGESIEVKIDNLELLEPGDIDQNLKFLHAFLSQNGHHDRSKYEERLPLPADFRSYQLHSRAYPTALL